MEYLSWEIIGSFSGMVGTVMLITQFTKHIGVLRKLPTNMWSYIVALVVMLAAKYFHSGLTLSEAALVPINAIAIALSAGGGFDAVSRMFPTVFRTRPPAADSSVTEDTDDEFSMESDSTTSSEPDTTDKTSEKGE